MRGTTTDRIREALSSVDNEREDGPVGEPVNPIMEELGENRGS